MRRTRKQTSTRRATRSATATATATATAVAIVAAALAASPTRSAASPCGPAPMRVIASIPDTAPRTHSMVVDPGVHRAYAQRLTGGVTVIDTIGHAVVATIAVSDPTRRPFGGGGIAADPALHRIYVTGNHAISVIDTKSNKVLFVMTDPLDATGQPLTISVDPRTHNIWVVRASGTTQSIVIYNIIGVRMGALATTDAESVPVTFDQYLGRAYFGQSDEIGVADETTLDTFSSLVDAPPVTYALAVDPNTHNIWTASDYSTTTLDPLGLKIASSAGGSQQVVLDAVKRRVYVTYGTGVTGKVTALDATTGARLGALGLDDSLSEALDPSTGNLFVSTSTGFAVIASNCT